MNNEIYKKLLKIQKEVGAIKKDAKNPFFKSNYFDINSLLAVVKPLLNENGLLLIQGLSHEGDNLLLDTQIVDVESGGIMSSVAILPDAGDAQKQGSAITYFRRYALVSLLALEAEDDDANSVSDVKKTKSFTRPTQLATPKQKDYLQKMLTQKGLNPLTDEELAQLTMAKASELIEKNKF